MAKIISTVSEELERIEEDSLFSAKSHFEAAQGWSRRHLWIGIPTTIAAAIASGTALADLTLVAAILAAFVSAATAVITFLDPKGAAERHLKAGNAYKALENDARILRLLALSGTADQAKLLEDLAVLNQRRNDLNTSSPQVPPAAYRAARAMIEAGETKYAVDKKDGLR